MNIKRSGLGVFIAVLLIGWLSLSVVPQLDADIDVGVTALEVAQAISVDDTVITTAVFETTPSLLATAVADDIVNSFPTEGGDYGILATGNVLDVTASLTQGNLGGGNIRGEGDFDVTILRIDLDVPSGRNCLSFDFQFFSTEFSTFVGSSFNDAFIAEIGSVNWTIDFFGNLTAPDNFAFAEDDMGSPIAISVNAAGDAAMSFEAADDTPYDRDNFSGNLTGGATELLRAATTVSPGATSLYLSIFDAGDPVLDSAVYLDNLILTTVADEDECQEGAQRLPTLSSILNTIPVGVPYSDSVAGAGVTDATTFEIASGSLPPGLVLDTDSGAITGTCTAATVANFTINALEDMEALDTRDYTITCTPITELTISKAFTDADIDLGDSTPLTITLVNPASNPPLTNVSFSDPLPDGLIYEEPVTSPQCGGGTVTITDGDTLQFSGGSLDTGASCSINVTVISDGITSGDLVNQTSSVTASSVGGDVSSDGGAQGNITIRGAGTGDGGDDDDDDDDDGEPSAAGAGEGLLLPGGRRVAPRAIFCEDLARDSELAMTASSGIGNALNPDDGEIGTVFCRIIAVDGSFVTDPGEVGIQSVIDRNVVQAVDLFGLLEDGTPVIPYVSPMQVCMRGSGQILFLNAADADRTVSGLGSFISNGYTCATVPNAGTVVLVGSLNAPAPLPTPTATDSGDAMDTSEGDTDAAPAAATNVLPAAAQVLSGCQVTTTNAPLNLRADPGEGGEIIAKLAFDLELSATARTNDWFQVVYRDMQGWVSADFVLFAGACGQ